MDPYNPHNLLWIFAILGLFRIVSHLRSNSFQTASMLRALMNTIIVVVVFFFLLSSVRRCDPDASGRSTKTLIALIEGEGVFYDMPAADDMAYKLLDSLRSEKQLHSDGFSWTNKNSYVLTLTKNQIKRTQEIFKVTHEMVADEKPRLERKLKYLLRGSGVPSDKLASVVDELQENMRKAINDEFPRTIEQYYPVYFLCAEIVGGSMYELEVGVQGDEPKSLPPPPPKRPRKGSHEEEYDPVNHRFQRGRRPTEIKGTELRNNGASGGIPVIGRDSEKDKGEVPSESSSQKKRGTRKPRDGNTQSSNGN